MIGLNERHRSAKKLLFLISRALVVGSGFEPLKAEPADLQSAPIGRSGNPPLSNKRRKGNKVTLTLTNHRYVRNELFD